MTSLLNDRCNKVTYAASPYISLVTVDTTMLMQTLAECICLSHESADTWLKYTLNSVLIYFACIVVNWKKLHDYDKHLRVQSPFATIMYMACLWA